MLFAMMLCTFVSYAYETSGGLPIRGFWNGYNSHQNVIECSNASSHNVSLSLALYDMNATLLDSLAFDLESGHSYHTVLDQNMTSNKYGTYLIQKTSGDDDADAAVYCSIVIYRLADSNSDKAVEYVYSLPPMNSLTGTSSGIYNSMNPSYGSNPVYNWLTVYNYGTENFSADVNVYSQSGVLDSTKSFSVSGLLPGERKDYPLGHQDGQIVGLYKIVPQDSSSPYVAFLTRYATDDNINFHFAFPLHAGQTSCSTKSTPVSTMDPATNWIEIANPSNSTQSIEVEMLSSDARVLYQDTLSIEPMSQYHIYVNQYLGERNLGIIRARCSNPDGEGFLMQSLYYGRLEAEDNAVEWACASQARDSSVIETNEHLLVPLNTYLETPNWTKISNLSGGEFQIKTTLFSREGESPTTLVPSLSLYGSLDIGIHEYSGYDFYGFGLFSSPDAGSQFSSEVIRVYPRLDGRIGYVMNVFGLIIPAGVDLVQQTNSTRWLPTPGMSWQWQLDTPVDTSVTAQVYDIDLFDNDYSVVDELHQQGRKVICYMDAGTWEQWRDDAGDFPSEVLGNSLDEWQDERWLDIGQIDLLAPIMRARLDMCKEKGFDAVEPDNIDGYDNNTGFSITYLDQLAYNIWLANEAHKRGLSIALKNDSEQTSDLISYFDFAILEDCFFNNSCQNSLDFVSANKAVFDAEYTDTGTETTDFCTQADILNIDAILKNRELDSELLSCE